MEGAEGPFIAWRTEMNLNAYRVMDDKQILGHGATSTILLWLSGTCFAASLWLATLVF